MALSKILVVLITLAACPALAGEAAFSKIASDQALASLPADAAPPQPATCPAVDVVRASRADRSVSFVRAPRLAAEAARRGYDARHAAAR